ncbi:MAG TPA: OmpA family protein [Bryobacteraceae bacterium]|nr:OmpA family protein [Bryobacteraceae bacterium]
MTLNFFTANKALAFTMVAGLAASGCATKKYVAKTVSPVEQRVGQVEKRTTDQGKTLDTVETDLSKTKERVLDLDSNLKQTGERVADASNRANQASSAAAQASQQAVAARSHADERANQVKTYVDALDTLKMTKTTAVLFAFGKSTLDADAKAALDEIAKEALSKRKFALEIEGFTDSQGSASANLALSQKRAESVVLYLTLNHKMPLRSIHVIGVGEEAPIADNKTRDGRKQNRRVEVRLFAPEIENNSALPSAQLR